MAARSKVKRPLKRGSITPLVEAVTRKSIDIVEGGGSMDNTRGRMAVPLDGSAISCRIRQHEVAHAMLSPKRPRAPRTLKNMTVQRAEDLRMNLYSTRRGIGDVLAAKAYEDWTKYEGLVGDRQNAITAAVATIGTGDFGNVLMATAHYLGPAVAAEAAETARAAWAALEAIENPLWRDTIRVAKAVQHVIDNPPPAPEPDESEGPGDGEGSGGESGEGDVEAGTGEGEGGLGGDVGPDEETGDESETKGGEGEEGLAPPDYGDDDRDRSGGGGGKDDDEEGGEESGEEGGKGADGLGDEGAPSGGDSIHAEEGADGGGADGGDTGGDGTGESGSPSGGAEPLDLPDYEEGDEAEKPLSVHDDTLRPEPPDEVEGAEQTADPDVEEAIRGMVDRTGYFTGHATVVPMKVVKPPRPKRLPKGIHGRTKVATVTGQALRHPARYATDKALFESVGRKVGGGTILIDCSGSMSLRPEHLEQVLTLAPAATIAAYSGRRDSGELRILAQDGRRVSDADLGPFYGGNVVDVPALEWLERQDAPRLWVCDGIVTGQSDRPGLNIRDACVDICRSANILRVGSVAALLDWMEQSRAGKLRVRKGRRL